jgi:hypothetical protein
VSRPRILPAGFIEPCIPTAARVPPAGPGWLHEIKYDGYRLVVRLEGRRVRLFTRRGHEWSDRFPRIREGLASLRTRSSTIDGEAVVLCPKTGLSLFDELLCVTPAGGAPCAADWPVGAGGLDGAAVGAGAAGVVGADAAGGVALGEVGDAAGRVAVGRPGPPGRWSRAAGAGVGAADGELAVGVVLGACAGFDCCAAPPGAPCGDGEVGGLGRAALGGDGDVGGFSTARGAGAGREAAGGAAGAGGVAALGGAAGPGGFAAAGGAAVAGGLVAAGGCPRGFAAGPPGGRTPPGVGLESCAGA